MSLIITPSTLPSPVAGAVYHYLRVPLGRLKLIEAVNFDTHFQRVVIYITPLVNLPADAVTLTPSSVISLVSGAQGTSFHPVYWHGDLEITREYSVVAARFSNVVIGDVLKLATIVEVP